MKKYICAIIAITIATISFAETEVPNESRDLSVRFALGSAPGWDEFEIVGLSGSLDDEVGARAELLVVKRFWGDNDSTVGGMLGGGIFVSSHEGTDEVGDSIESSVFGAMIQGGVAFRAGEIVVIELGPYLGLGSANNEITGFSDGNGPFGLFGMKTGVFVRLGPSVELGLELGYEGIATTQEISDGFTTEDIDFTGSGARFAGVVMVCF